MDSAVRLPSGRILEISEGGDPTGVPIFTIHGTPGSRGFYPQHTEDARVKGIRLISYSRPGYGGSTKLPGWKVADSAPEVAAIADHLGLDRFAVWGHSGGGPPSIACAAGLPDRVVAAASLCGAAPYPAEGLDWLSGMGEFNVQDFQLMLRDRDAWEKKTREDAKTMLNASGADLMEFLGSLLSDVDKGVLSGELVGYLQAEMRGAFSVGADGAVDDGLAAARPWGFDFSSIKVPMQLWHGRHDRFVPFSHGEWLARRIPGVEAHLEENEGHLSVFVNRIPEVHHWLLSKF